MNVQYTLIICSYENIVIISLGVINDKMILIT